MWVLLMILNVEFMNIKKSDFVSYLKQPHVIFNEINLISNDSSMSFRMNVRNLKKNLSGLGADRDDRKN
jgi:hypothetical protein